MSFDSFNDMLDNAVHLLRDNFGDTITVERNFPKKTKPLPLNKTTVTVGSKGCITSSKCIGNAVTPSLIGKGLSAQIEISIYVPQSFESKSAYTTLSKALCVLSGNKQFGITQAEHGVLTSVRATGCFELHCTLTSSLYETEEQP